MKWPASDISSWTRKRQTYFLSMYGAQSAEINVVTFVKAWNRKSGGIIHCFFLLKSCQLEVRGFDIKIEL